MNILTMDKLKDNEITWSKKYQEQDTGAAIRLGQQIANCQIQEVE